jgi:hypothetical protein
VAIPPASSRLTALGRMANQRSHMSAQMVVQQPFRKQPITLPRGLASLQRGGPTPDLGATALKDAACKEPG